MGGWFMHMTFGTNELNLKGTTTNPFGGRYIEPIALGATINSSSNWGNSFPEPFIGDDTDPNFQNLEDRYIGCKFTLGSNTHFGWVSVSFDSNKTLTVKDYAYESTPNTAINAGDIGTTTTVTEFDFNNYFSCFPIPVKNTLTIQNKKSIQINQVSIVNLYGQKIISMSKMFSNNISIDFSQLKTGVYFLKIET